jgi:hypothetical protein
VVSFTLAFITMPVPLDPSQTLQQKAETLIRNFLSASPNYMALYFSDIDTAYRSLSDDPFYNRLSSRVEEYQDSTTRYSRINFKKADSLYTIYKQWSLRKDSMRIHYKPPPLGWLMIHHYQLGGTPWTDSFMMNFSCTKILKVKEAIE